MSDVSGRSYRSRQQTEGIAVQRLFDAGKFADEHVLGPETWVSQPLLTWVKARRYVVTDLGALVNEGLGHCSWDISTKEFSWRVRGILLVLASA